MLVLLFNDIVSASNDYVQEWINSLRYNNLPDNLSADYSQIW